MLSFVSPIHPLKRKIITNNNFCVFLLFFGVLRITFLKLIRAAVSAIVYVCHAFRSSRLRVHDVMLRRLLFLLIRFVINMVCDVFDILPLSVLSVYSYIYPNKQIKRVSESSSYRHLSCLLPPRGTWWFLHNKKESQ